MPAAIGRYEIRGLLGRGGFGAVYRGYDRNLDRQVAIKVPLLKPTPELEELFPQEARKLAQLKHPSIVTVHDVGVHEGVCFIVSEYLDGPNLNHWMQNRTIGWQEAATIIATLADALAAAHARSIIHRDMKPANVIMIEHSRRFCARAGRFWPCSERIVPRRLAGPIRQRHRHAQLHVPRAGTRRGQSHRWPNRHLRPGRDPVPAAERPACRLPPQRCRTDAGGGCA